MKRHLQIIPFFLFLLMSLSVEASMRNDIFYIEKNVNEADKIILELKNKRNDEIFQLFSHGKSGELFLNNHWMKKEEIALFIKSKISKKTNHINIYGCEFGKDRKGKQAILYLEKQLGISISASTDITGKSGNWKLEIGKPTAVIDIKNYNYTLQTLPGDDFDNDGVINSVDLDDDNDGILDAIENPTCFYTTTEAGVLFKVSTGLTSSTVNSVAVAVGADIPTMRDNIITTVAASNHIIAAAQTNSTASIIYTLEYPTPVKLSSVSVVGATASWGTGSFAVLEGSTDGVTFIDALSAPLATSAGTTKTWTVTLNTNNYYKYYRIRVSTVGSTTPTFTNYEVSSVLNTTGYNPSANPKPLCASNSTTNIDGDANLNQYDLDSDGDGCSDAYEAGATTITTAAYQFPDIDTNNDGLVDAVDAGNDGSTDYTNYYYIFANTNTISLCLDSDNDGTRNFTDLDDDNDGIVDAIESPNCYYTAGEIQIPSTVSTQVTTTGAIANTFDNNSTTQFNFTGASTMVNLAVFEITPFLPIQATSLNIVYTGATDNIFGSNPVFIQGLNGSTWETLTNPTPLAAVANVQKFAISPTKAYRKYRILGGATGTVSAGIITEVTLSVGSGYIASAYPKPTCTNDIDGDSINNQLDLDSDSDGCSDAFESGATTITTANYQFPDTDTNNDGLVDAVDSNNDGITNYTSTYNLYAIVSGLKSCLDTDADLTNDIVDLDDDNDGILDTNETTKCYTTGFNFVYDVYKYSGDETTGPFALPATYSLATDATWASANLDNISPSMTAKYTPTDQLNPFTLSFNYRLAADFVNFFSDAGTEKFYNNSGPSREAVTNITVYKMTIPTTILNKNTFNYTITSIDEDVAIVVNGVVVAGPTGSNNTPNTQTATFTLKGGDILEFRLRNRLISNQGGFFTMNNATAFFNSILCSVDTDSDGLLNHLDLDSDADGCSDAYESGATLDKTTNFKFPDVDTNNDGLVNAVDAAGDGTIDYISTYKYATNAAASMCLDTDNDGIGDLVDLDDDNDGVLDIIECPALFSGLIAGGGFSEATPTNNWYLANASSFYDTSAGVPYTYGTTNQNSTLTGGVFDEQGGSNTTGGLQNIVIENSEPQALVTRFSEPLVGSATYQYAFDLGNRASNGSAASNFFVRIYNADTNTVTSIIETGTLSSLPGYNSVPSFKNFSGTFTVPTTGNYYMLFSVTGAGGIGDDIVVDRVASSGFSANVCDTDGDTIPNYLDLDSDGDGCSDAYEAGATLDKTANFKFPDIDTNNDGLVDAVDSGNDGNTDYTNYYNIFALSNALSLCLDSDNDGTRNFTDLDDDNDGVVDAVESPACYYSAGEIQIPSSVTTSVANTGAIANTFDNNSTTTFAFTNATSTVNTPIFEITPVLPIQATSLNIVYSGGADNPFGSNPVFIQGLNGSAWETLSNPTPVAAVANVQKFVIAPTKAYRKYRILGGTTGTVGSNAITEVTLSVGAGYIASAYPKQTCVNDTDGDTVNNQLDLDSDADGCSDAFESGATTITTANYQFPDIDANNDGLVDTVDSNNDGITNYINTYDAYAIVTGLKSCSDTDADGINDIVDLDDDNDGVLDTAEASKCYTSGFNLVYDVLKYTGDETTGPFALPAEYLTPLNGVSWASANLDNLSPSVTAKYTTSGLTAFNLNFVSTVAYDFVDTYSDAGSEKFYNNSANGREPNRSITIYRTKIPAEILNTLTFNYTIATTDEDVAYLVNGVVVAGPTGFNNTPNTQTGNFTVKAGDILEFRLRNPTINHYFGSFILNNAANVFNSIVCSTDTDTDGVLNHLDLDSDADGCSDAYEAGATKAPTAKVATYKFPDIDANNDGLVDAVDATSDGIVDYANYYDVYATTSALSACLDSDNDGIGDLVDIDDDNDGILDAVESPNCYYTATEIELPKIVTTDISLSAGVITSAFDANVTTPTFAFTNAASMVNSSVFTITTQAPLKASSLYIKYPAATSNAVGTTANSVRVEGWNGTTWVALSPSLTPVAAAANLQTFPITLNQALYTQYRLYGLIGTVSNIAIAEVGLTAASDYIASRYPKATCAPTNTDGDALPNNLDLDSDGDGCSDAYEVGATTDKTVNFKFTGADTNSDGLVDTVDNGANGGTSNDGLTDYSSSYAYVISASFNTCLDSDNDGVGDLVDLDDDNDGVLDAVESPNCYNTSAYWLFSNRNADVTVSTTLAMTATNFLTRLVDGINLINGPSFAVTFATATTAPQTVYQFDLNVPTALKTIYVSYVNTSSHFAAGAVIKIQGSQDGISWTDLNGSGQTMAATNTNGVIPALGGTALNYQAFTTSPLNNTSYTKYRLYWTGGGSISNLGTSNEAYFLTSDNYKTSANPKLTCTVTDSDGDSIPNIVDLDSDGDGCSDAFEAGATTNKTANYVFPNIDSNNDGLVDAVDNGAPSGTANDGNTDYTSTYFGYSLFKTLNACSDTDGDGILDIYDIDDDNDGILDTIEGYQPTGTRNIVADVNDAAKTVGVFNTEGFRLFNVALSINPNTTYNRPISNAANEINAIINIPSVNSWINYDITQLYNGNAEFELTNRNDNPNGTTEQAGFSLEFNSNLYDVTLTSTVSPIAGLAVGNAIVSGVVYNNPTQANVFVLNIKSKYPIAINTTNAFKFGWITGVNNEHPGLRFLSTAYIDRDTDADSIPDRLDLDSDGDGCPDAKEATVPNTLLAGNIVNNPSLTTTNVANAVAAGPYGNNGFASSLENNDTVNATANFPSTNYNQNALVSGVNTCLDSDNDGIGNWTDIDDDNDGILDAVESPNCYYTVTEASTIATITSGLTSPDDNQADSDIQILHDGNSATFTFNWDAGQNIIGSTLFTIKYNTPIAVSSITLVNATTFGAGTTAILQGSLNGLNWTTLSSSNVALSTTANKIFSTTSTIPYLYYRIFGNAGTVTTVTTTLIAEITAVPITTVYLESAHPKLNCIGIDTDGDTIPNNLDLDSDGDGCSDAIEGSATFTYSNVSASTMAGGNSGGSYNGSSSNPVVLNLSGPVGNTATTIGVPTSAGTGQAIGTSQDGSTLDPNCIPLCVAGATAPILNAATNFVPTNNAYSIPCGSSTANLSGINSSNTPANTVLTWHNATPATDANKVNTVNAISGATLKFYAAFYDGLAGCYSPSTEITIYGPICAVDDNYSATSIVEGIGATLPSIYTNDSYNGATVSPPTTPITFNYETWNTNVATVDSTTGAITVLPGAVAGTYEFYYKICDADVDAVPNSNCTTAKVTIVISTAPVCYKPGQTAAGGGLSSVTAVSEFLGLASDPRFWISNLPKNGALVMGSRNKGFVITRIANPETVITGTNAVKGMLVFDTAANCLKMYDGTQWFCLTQKCVDN